MVNFVLSVCPLSEAKGRTLQEREVASFTEPYQVLFSLATPADRGAPHGPKPHACVARLTRQAIYASAGR